MRFHLPAVLRALVGLFGLLVLPPSPTVPFIERLLPSLPFPFSFSVIGATLASSSDCRDGCQIAYPNFRLQMLLPCSRYSDRDTTTFANLELRENSTPEQYASVTGLSNLISKNNLAERPHRDNYLALSNTRTSCSTGARLRNSLIL